MAGIVHKINNRGNVYSIGSTAYFTCSTAAATAAKVATLAADTTATITLVTGLTIHVKFTNTNTATTPTLNINSTGAKPIVKYGTSAPGKTTTTTWYAGSVVSFTYDGTSWVMNDYKYDTDSNTDTKVTQTHSAATTPYPILFGGNMAGTTVTDGSYFNNKIYVFPWTGAVYAQEFWGSTFVADNYSLGDDGLWYDDANINYTDGKWASSVKFEAPELYDNGKRVATQEWVQNNVSSPDITAVQILTSSEYRNLQTIQPNILYIVRG